MYDPFIRHFNTKKSRLDTRGIKRIFSQEYINTQTINYIRESNNLYINFGNSYLLIQGCMYIT
jgi:hypothetical protein